MSNESLMLIDTIQYDVQMTSKSQLKFLTCNQFMLFTLMSIDTLKHMNAGLLSNNPKYDNVNVQISGKS